MSFYAFHFISEFIFTSAHLVKRAVASTGQTEAALQAVLILAAGVVPGLVVAAAVQKGSSVVRT